RLAAFLAFLFVPDSAVVLLVQLIEPDRFFRIHRVVNADRNGNQRKPNVAFPDRSHNSPRVVVFNFGDCATVVWTFVFGSIDAFIRLAQSMTLTEEKAKS